MTASRAFTIGQLAARAGVNLETIRYYERIGLMPEPARSAGGYRLYDEAHRQRLTFIRRGRELGFGIDEIRSLLDLAQPERRSCDDVRLIAAAQLEAVRAKLGDLHRLEAILTDTVQRCGAQPSTPTCPVLEMLESAP